MVEKKEIIAVLEFIDENRNNGVSVDQELLYHEFERTFVKKAVQWGLIEFSGTDYYLTEKGYNALNQGKISKNTRELNEVMKKFNESSEKSNKKMINLSRLNIGLFIIAIVISGVALIISYNLTYGNARLNWEYSIAGLNNEFFYYNNSIMLEFIVKNDGFSSTVYNVEPIVECAECSVTISFDGEEPFEEISKPKIKSISAKSGHFVMIIIRDIKPEEVGEEFTVLVRDFLNKEREHNYIKFKRAEDDLTKFFLDVLYGQNEKTNKNQ